MTNIVMLAVCLTAGLLLRVTGRMPAGGHAAINSFIIHVALPALIVSQIHHVNLAADMVWPVLMPWIMFALSAALFAALGWAMGFTAGTTGALVMTAGLANTSFVGLPMIETFYGPGHLSTGILIDQLGTYLVLSTAGIVIACLFSSSAASGRDLLRRVVTFPPLIALAAAFALMWVDYPPWLTGLLRRLGDTLAPLALVSVGLQLRLDQFSGNRLALGCGLGFKLVLAPLMLTLLYVGVLDHAGETTQVTLFESAMGPMIGGSIVAVQYGLNPPLVTLMVGVGIALSFLTLPVWHAALAGIA